MRTTHAHWENRLIWGGGGVIVLGSRIDKIIDMSLLALAMCLTICFSQWKKERQAICEPSLHNWTYRIAILIAIAWHYLIFADLKERRTLSLKVRRHILWCMKMAYQKAYYVQ